MKELSRITNLSKVCAGSYFVISEKEARVLKSKDYIVGAVVDENYSCLDGYFVHNILGEQTPRYEVSKVLKRDVKKERNQYYE